jgi:CYTH domain-containing protein
MIEIERKFLVRSDTFKKNAVSSERITQGFLNTHPERTVRIRVTGDEGFITVKGISNKAGSSRFEWEKDISKQEALELLLLCEEGIIDKIRYNVNWGDHLFQVDEFHGNNEGLVIAEIELKNENDKFEKPKWLGREVTGILKYYNSRLSKRPYSTWKK